MNSKKTQLDKLRKKVYKQHDKVCNQKYADILPYSFHLGAAEAQGLKFIHLLTPKEAIVVRYALPMHDTEEDARMTYNNNVDLVFKYSNSKEILEHYPDKREFAIAVADVIHSVTDRKGKNRKERKSDGFYADLSETEKGIFTKLSDLAANTLFSKLTGHPMYDKYKREFPNFKKKLFVERFSEFFDYIEKI